MFKFFVISILVSSLHFSVWAEDASQNQVPQANASAAEPIVTPAVQSVAPAVPVPVVVSPAAAIPFQEAKYTIKQIIKSHNLVVIQSNLPVEIQEGKIFLVTFDDGKQCSLILKESAKTLFTVDSSECERRSYITLASPVELSLAVIPQVGNRVTPKESLLRSSPTFGKRFAANIYYSVADKAKFDDAKVRTSSGASGSVSASYGTESSPGIGVSYTNVEPQSWGFSGSLLYEPKREVQSFTVSGPGGTFTSSATGTKAKLSFLLLEGNAIYRWHQFYIPLGLNLSIPSLTDTGSAVYDVKGGVGAFLGAGLFVLENSSIEVFVRSVGFNMTATDGSTTIDFQNGYMSGAGFGWKYYF